MPDQTTPFDSALVKVIEFARRHGVDTAFGLAPGDFGHQRVGSGHLHVTYVDGDHVVSAHLDRHGHVRRAVGTVEWIHDESDEERGPCIEYCGECRACEQSPCECPADAPDAYRDRSGCILRRSDGAFIVGDASRPEIETHLALWADRTEPGAAEMRDGYRAALALLDQEANANA